MTAPSLRGGEGVVSRRSPGTPLDRIADTVAVARRSHTAVPSFLCQVWAVAVLLTVGVTVVGGKGVPDTDRHRLHLSPVVGRAGSILYHNTMQYLMDQMAPSMPPSR